MFTISGFPITQIEGLANNGSYISVAEGDVFRAIRYNINNITTPVLSEEELNREKQRQERLHKVVPVPAPVTVRKPAAARFAWGATFSTPPVIEHIISEELQLGNTSQATLKSYMTSSTSSPAQVLVIQHEYPGIQVIAQQFVFFSLLVLQHLKMGVW